MIVEVSNHAWLLGITPQRRPKKFVLRGACSSQYETLYIGVRRKADPRQSDSWRAFHHVPIFGPRDSPLRARMIRVRAGGGGVEMTKFLKSLAAVILMGVPVWFVLVGLSRDRPSSILIHLSEPNVRVCVGDQEFEADSTTVGPVDVSPGEHRVRVMRGQETLYEYPIVVQNGERREISAGWMKRDNLPARGELLSDVSEQRLEGHASEIIALTFSRDGSWVASASTDGAVRVWDANEGRELALLKGHAGKVVALAALSDLRQVMTVSDNAIIRYWDIDSGREIRTCETGISRTVLCAAITPDGSRVALGCQGGQVIVHNLETGEFVRRHTIDPATPGGLAFSPGGETLLVGLIGDPRTPHDVHVLDVATGRVLTKLHGHEAPVWSVAFLPDGRRAISAGTDRTLRVWDIATGREVKRFDDHPGVILCLAVSRDGRRAIAGTGHAWAGGWKLAGSYGLEVWDLEAGVGLGRFETTEPVRTVVLSPDGRRAYAAGDDRVIHSWDLPTGSAEPAVAGGAQAAPTTHTASRAPSRPMSPSWRGTAPRSHRRVRVRRRKWSRLAQRRPGRTRKRSRGAFRSFPSTSRALAPTGRVRRSPHPVSRTAYRSGRRPVWRRGKRACADTARPFRSDSRSTRMEPTAARASGRPGNRGVPSG